MIQVLLADDHPIVRHGVKNLIAVMPDMTVVAEAASGVEVLDCLRSHSINLLLLDMFMPEPSGVELISRIRNHGYTQPILVLSMVSEISAVTRAIRAGANGFIGKDAPPEQIMTAIRKTADGGKYINAELAEQMIFMNCQPENDARHGQLSNREFEIFRLLTAGHSVNQVAKLLRISNKTVSTHKTHVLEKLHVKGTTELVKYAIKHHLFD